MKNSLKEKFTLKNGAISDHQFFTLVIFIIGGFVRWIAATKQWHSLMTVEFVTPLTDFKALMEGLYLYKKGLSPYTSGFFSMPPFVLLPFLFCNELSDNAWIFTFILIDLSTAYAIMKSSEAIAEKNLLPFNRVKPLRFTVVLMFLFNPFIILTCATKSTQCFDFLLLSMSLYFSVHGYCFLTMLTLATCTCLSLYPLVLLPATILVVQQTNPKWSLMKNILYCMSSFVGVVFFLNFLSFQMTGNWQFILQAYGFVLTMPDLTPNLGLYWYLFSLLFIEFRTLFAFAFQLHTFLYGIPVALRLKERPLAAWIILLMMTSILKTYPTLGDMGFYVSLVPLLISYIIYMKSVILFASGTVVVSLLSPVVWRFWVQQGSGNANFFFAITLVYAMTQIIFVSDLFRAVLKFELYAKNPHLKEKIIASKSTHKLVFR